MKTEINFSLAIEELQDGVKITNPNPFDVLVAVRKEHGGEGDCVVRAHESASIRRGKGWYVVRPFVTIEGMRIVGYKVCNTLKDEKEE